MDNTLPTHSRKTDRSIGRAILEGGITKNSQILTLDMRRDLLALQPYETLVFYDQPDHPLNEEGAGSYLRRVQQAVLVFFRERPTHKVATRRSKDQETGSDVLYVVRKPGDE